MDSALFPRGTSQRVRARSEGNERLQVKDHPSMYFEHLDDPGFTFDRAHFAQPFLISSYHENLLNRRLRLHRRLSRS
jgi:hypothetical protein